MSQLKIKKGLEEQLLGLVEIHPEMIVWAYRPEWILYSNNNWDINETMGVDTESFLKVMTKMDEETKIEVKEKGLEFKKYNRQRQYTIKYTLITKKTDPEKKDKIEKLQSLEGIELRYKLQNNLLKDLLEGINNNLQVRKEEKLYFTDEEDTILVPRDQKEEKITIQSEYDFTIIKEVLQGIDKVKKVELQILTENILRMVIELEGVEEIKFYFILSEMI